MASNVGTWLQNYVGGFLDDDVVDDVHDVLVALVQAATSLPSFLLALPAGALADVIDRRRLLLVTQGWMTRRGSCPPGC